MIGIVNLQKGIYILESHSYNIICNYVDSNSHELWHSWLGHIFDIGLKDISRVFFLIYCKPNLAHYDSCHNAKQNKILFFPSSTIHIDAPFELLHDDLWCPYAITSILGQRYF